MKIHDNIPKGTVVEGELWPVVIVKVWESGSYSKEEGTKRWLNIIYQEEENEAIFQMIELKLKQNTNEQPPRDQSPFGEGNL